MPKKKPPIENAIYASIIGACEQMEHAGQYLGSGHHLAQRLTKEVSAALLSKQQKKIFSLLNNDPKSTQEIAKATKIPSKNVSSVLIQMHRNTLLIRFTRSGKFKYWTRA